LGWQPEKPLDERPRHDRVVVIKHAFLPEDFEVGVTLIVEMLLIYFLFCCNEMPAAVVNLFTAR